MSTQQVSKQTQRNWWIDAGLLISALLAALSGIYFLFLPNGGYQGGRNPYYNIQVMFERSTWEDLHTWGGIAMVVVVVIHLAIHWSWVTNMIRKGWNGLVGKGSGLNRRGRWNLALNLVVAVSFVLSAVSGVYFFFVPGERWAVDPMFLFSRTTWDLVHTWSSVLLIVAVLVHLAIHWMWVTKVTKKMIGQLTTTRSTDQSTISVSTRKIIGS